MQAALEAVAAKCAKEADEYARCVDENPERWPSVCAGQKSALTACAAKHSGLVNKLKERCHWEIEQYERCLQANAGVPDTCYPQLERLWQCTEGGSQPPHVCGPECSH